MNDYFREGFEKYANAQKKKKKKGNNVYHLIRRNKYGKHISTEIVDDDDPNNPYALNKLKPNKK